EAIQSHGHGPHGQPHLEWKQAGLDRLLQYDGYLRKTLVDHFYDVRVSLNDLVNQRATELGDFVGGLYEHRVRRHGQAVQLTLSRLGKIGSARLRLTKEISLQPRSDTLEVHYLLENLPHNLPVLFAVELNFAGMAAGADDRYFHYDGRPRAGQLQTLQDLTN